MYNKYFIFLSLFFLFAFSANDLSAQRKKKKDPLEDLQLYIFKADWSAAKDWNDCTYFMQMNKESDSLFVCRYYHKLGPMVRQESYKDSDLTIIEGRFCWYNSEGYLDSTGWVSNKKKDGYWEYYKDNKLVLSIRYDNGKFLHKTDYINKLFYFQDGTSVSLEEKIKADSIRIDSFKTVQVESKFKQGQQGWMSYIQRNLKTPDRLMNALGLGTHTAIVVFMVDKTGAIDRDIYLEKSVEWSGDRTVLQLIKYSPKWEPAYQNNEAVFYKMKQSLSFQVSD